ncbi:MAG: helix-turn-helix domain-containing protein [Planctomycetes bacterium]|nr:helix-turn-helix domain-containing protein [Planctomycetota bacterium]
MAPDNLYAAHAARDARFDGVYFLGVKSTGVYCRSVCPAKTPKRVNCVFFMGAAAAEREGFRPSLRCLPECAPGVRLPDLADAHGLGAWATRELMSGVRRGGEAKGVEEIAARAGVTSRHLRRLVLAHAGATPIEIVQTQRLLMAKQLAGQTKLSMDGVARASGFGSVRRLQTAFRERYGLSIRDVRRKGGEVANGGVLTLQVGYRPPMQWEHMLEFLAGRAIPGVEVVGDGVYARTWRSASDPKVSGWWRVRLDAARHRVMIEVSEGLAMEAGEIVATVRRMFDLDAQPQVIDEWLARSERFAASVKQAPGLRIPGAADGFECGVRAILGQQVTLKAATTLMARVASKWGAPLETGVAGLTRLTPTAAKMSTVSVDELGELGVIRQRGKSIIALAEMMKKQSKDGGVPQRAEGMIEELQEVPGIGPWTARYIAMRAWGSPDVFVSGDLVLRKMLGVERDREAERIAEAWRPWRSYAVMHLWRMASQDAQLSKSKVGTRRKQK